MNYTNAIVAMQKFFELQWDKRTPVIWGEDDATKTPDSADETGNGVSWVRMNIAHNDGGQASMGSPGANRFRHIGIITMQVFHPEGDYGVTARKLVSDILEIYQGANDAGIQYYNARSNEIGKDGYGFYQINVLIEFRYDNIT